MRQWFEFVCSQRSLNHYHLLGLELFESRPEAIEAAATRITLFLQNLAAGPARDQADQLLQDVAAAQLCLLGPAKKAAYDAQLRVELGGDDGPQTPADDQLNPAEIAPLIKVETMPAGSRGKGKQTGRRRDSGTFVPPPDFGPVAPTADRPALAPESAAIPIFADGRGGDQRLTAKRPATQRSLTAGRRRPSAWSGWIMLGVCGVSAAAVVALLAHLLDQPPVAMRPAARQVAPAATMPEAPPAPKPQETRPSETPPPEKAAPRPRQPTTEQGGVREYSKQELTQRRQTIDSFAAMAQSQETKLHRNEPPGMPQEPEQPQVGRIEEAPVAITSGLLAHWSFEEKSPAQAIDDSPQVRPADLDGRPVSIADGAFGSALRFDGQDDCLRVPEGMLKGAAGTISLWLRRGSAKESTFLVDSAEEPARFCLLLKDGKLTGGFGPDVNSKPVGAGAQVGSGKWHHVVLTWKSGGELALYLDGQPVGRRMAAQLPDPTGVVIGKNAVTGTYSAFDADEIRLFSRTLSPKEVTLLSEG